MLRMQRTGRIAVWRPKRLNEYERVQDVRRRSDIADVSDRSAAQTKRAKYLDVMDAKELTEGTPNGGRYHKGRVAGSGIKTQEKKRAQKAQQKEETNVLGKVNSEMRRMNEMKECIQKRVSLRASERPDTSGCTFQVRNLMNVTR